MIFSAFAGREHLDIGEDNSTRGVEDGPRRTVPDYVTTHSIPTRLIAQSTLMLSFPKFL